jgi:hypothetical protein
LDLVSNGNPSGALEYKNSFVPKRVGKFISLLDERDSEGAVIKKHKKENENKIDLLRKQSIWLSRLDMLNDPFEFKPQVLDKTTSTLSLAEQQYYEDWLKTAQDSCLITCFSSVIYSNLPLWAHYSNNHKGFCIILEIIDKTRFYPVIYQKERYIVPDEIAKRAPNLWRVNDMKPEYQDYWSALTFFATCTKYSRWSNEKEIRYVMNLFPFTNDKHIRKVSMLPAKIKKILIGKNCVRKDEIRDIAKELRLEVKEMYINDESLKYRLYEKKVSSL